MQPIINSLIPEFKVEAYKDGQFITVTDQDVKGKWAIFFFYPADFTFVCPTELVGIFCKYRLTLCTQSMARCFCNHPYHQISDACRSDRSFKPRFRCND